MRVDSKTWNTEDLVKLQWATDCLSSCILPPFGYEVQYISLFNKESKLFYAYDTEAEAETARCFKNS